jgi:hypothetical protein
MPFPQLAVVAEGDLPTGERWAVKAGGTAEDYYTLRAFAALTAEDRPVHRACCMIMLQGQLSLRIRPGARAGIRYAIGSYDLGRHAATPLGATWLVR